jgi:hypothetical protein
MQKNVEGIKIKEKDIIFSLCREQEILFIYIDSKC